MNTKKETVVNVLDQPINTYITSVMEGKVPTYSVFSNLYYIIYRQYAFGNEIIAYNYTITILLYVLLKCESEQQKIYLLNIIKDNSIIDLHNTLYKFETNKENNMIHS